MAATTPTLSVTPKNAIRSDVLWNKIMIQVSSFGLFKDSKYFVDCPVLRAWDDVANEWDKLISDGLSKRNLKNFITDNFGLPGR